MSVENNDEADKLLCCASCGIAEIDDVKLKECDGCDLVKYCSDECQLEHRPEHEEACKKRAAELRDELLFKKSESTHHGDCPICCLPMLLDLKKCTVVTSCCSKTICIGCSYANRLREIEGRLKHSCPFCREPVSKTKEEHAKLQRKRIEANDPVALRHEGGLRYRKGDYHSAFEYFRKAAALGDAKAHYQLAAMYCNGRGVEKDERKYVYHLEEAAIGGHPKARHNLGVHEWNNHNDERAVKHWTISASQGSDLSIKMLMKAFKEGHVSKEDLASALRAHQAAVDATKSPQRDDAEKLLSNYGHLIG